MTGVIADQWVAGSGTASFTIVSRGGGGTGLGGVPWVFSLVKEVEGSFRLSEATARIPSPGTNQKVVRSSRFRTVSCQAVKRGQT